MVNMEQLSKIYKQNLENDIILYVSKMKILILGKHLIFIIQVNYLSKLQEVIAVLKIWMPNILRKI